MKQLIFLILLLPIFTDAQYAINTIPDSLLKNSNVVERMYHISIEIKNPGKAKITTKYAYTVLNEDGNRVASYSSYYNKFQSVGSIKGTLYDANGKEVKQVRKKDIMDLSGNDEDNLMYLMSDTRYKVHRFYTTTYPYTVEYEDEREIDGIFHLPDWRPVRGSFMAVENSRLSVTTPTDYTIRYKQYNYDAMPIITNQGDKKTYTWEIKNVPAKKSEAYGPTWDEINPTVLLAPSDFEIEGFKGSMDSWKNFGLFIKTLNEGRDVLPDVIKQKVHTITDGVTSVEEKVNLLYKFMQQNTRYISIQLGIGGWRPFDANYVINKKYGDCKALSNYMVALLKEAGIKANYVLIRGGDNEEDIVADFPSNQFNHAIACVPLKNDTIWLECTSQTVAPGYMGEFTGNRKALVITEDGGVLVNTPRYEKEQNLLDRKVHAIVDVDGHLTAKVVTRFTGIQQDNLHGIINNSSKEEQLKFLKRAISLPTYDVEAFKYTEGKNKLVPEIEEALQLKASNYATVSGKRLFVIPNMFSQNGRRFTSTEERKYPIKFTSAWIDIDTVNIQIPLGYIVESKPAAQNIINRFGKYQTDYIIKEGLLQYTRLHECNYATFPASDYKELSAFYEAIYKADRGRIVLVKKDQ